MANWPRARRSRPAPGVVALIAFLIAPVFLRAAEVIPPAPPNHFNDYAGIVRQETITQLNGELAQFERDTSNQIVVAIYPRIQSESSVEDYTVRVAQNWGAGQRDRRNGAVLFVFQQSRDVRIVTGYGLEGALPDALCKQIIENEIVPRFRNGDFDGGLAAGVRAMMAATRGEYRGTGRTAAGTGGRPGAIGQGGIVLLVMLAFMIMGAIRARSRRSLVYGRRGRRTMWGGGPWIGRGGGWGGGGGGGGTFSGGGGSFGGGGAGGKW
ncbi:MAG: TPM domain-containing protein [Opitutaceae bacterium]